MRLFALFIILTLSLTASGQERNRPEMQSLLQGQGYQKWEWMESTCTHCPIAILLDDPVPESDRVKAFVQTLAHRKAELQSLYMVDGREYNLLSQMAIGILGRESQFFTSRRYVLKENFPGLISFLKYLRSQISGNSRDASPNSRGPTQIKVVPEKISQRYGIEEDDLYLPENAALATMGFLIESLNELKRRVITNQLGFVNQANYVDYLPYIYFGGTRALVTGRATPERNLYVRQMKANMEGVQIYEGPQSNETMTP